MTIEESILQQVLRLLKKDVPESVKMLGHCFQFFINYASVGRYEVSRRSQRNDDERLFPRYDPLSASN